MNRRNFIKRVALFAPMTFVTLVCAMPAHVNPAFYRRPSAASGGGGWTLIGSGVTGASADSISATTASYNTTGASVIYIIEAENKNPNDTPTDSVGGNTWIKDEQRSSFGNNIVSVWHCFSPNTGSAQTFTVNGGVVNTFPSIIVLAFSGGGSATDKVNGNFNASAGTDTTCTTGSITPTTSGQLLISGFSYNFSGSTASVDSGFNTPINVAPTASKNQGVAASWLVQTSAAAINPTWTAGASGKFCAAITSTKP